MKAIAVLLSLGIGFASALLLVKNGYFYQPVSVATLVDGGIYTGVLLDGRIEGQGTVRWPGGERYRGEFRGGLFHGQGEYTDRHGTRYLGTFEQGQFSGQGKIESEHDGIYEGQTAGWQMHGQGEYRDGSLVYRGTFDKDDFSGEGELIEAGELVYRGGFEGWLYQGAGTLAFANGDRYQGQFSHGELDGKGTMHLAEARDGVSDFAGVWRDGRLVASEQSAYVESYEADIEQALYAERALLEDALARVPAGDPSRAEVYFLGIAGDGTQRVFTREVTAFRDYFDSLAPFGERQINLLNDRTMIGKQPMATLTSIERAIAAIAGKMNLAQDVLLVYISSHGSEDHHISLDNESVSLADLSAVHLSRLLRDSGIRWQVVFVSACYSGGFIGPLQGDSTLIMTAASAEETSFGCSDEAELTYFGQALLKSLPQADDPQTVFTLLRVIIEGREAVEALNSSRPQFYMGEAMAEKLKSVRGLFRG